jgi:hypothetical protein
MVSPEPSLILSYGVSINSDSMAAGCWLLAAGCWLLAAGCWLLAAGCWLLAAGCWLLAAGCWLLFLLKGSLFCLWMSYLSAHCYCS